MSETWPNLHPWLIIDTGKPRDKLVGSFPIHNSKDFPVNKTQARHRTDLPLAFRPQIAFAAGRPGHNTAREAKEAPSPRAPGGPSSRMCEGPRVSWNPMDAMGKLPIALPRDSGLGSAGPTLDLCTRSWARSLKEKQLQRWTICPIPSPHPRQFWC